MPTQDSSPSAPPSPLPDPSAALAAAFDTIRRTRMQGIPILNEALRVEAVGFRRWQDCWLGVLVTPWCMNLVLMPAESASWPSLRVGEKSTRLFPAGRFDFIFGRETLLGEGARGETLMCSLFSPMFEFADHDGARDTALAALAALFDEQNIEATDIVVGPAPVTLQQDAAAVAEKLEREEAEAAAQSDRDAGDSAAPTSVSKRDFLRGRWTARVPESVP